MPGFGPVDQGAIPCRPIFKKMKPCKKCGECCKAIAEEILQPKTKDDYNDLKWYLWHENINLAIDKDNKWVIEIKTRCKHLTKNNQCKIYNQRPPVCRNYSPSQCPASTKEFKHHFKTEKQLERYLKNKNKI